MFRVLETICLGFIKLYECPDVLVNCTFDSGGIIIAISNIMSRILTVL